LLTKDVDFMKTHGKSQRKQNLLALHLIQSFLIALNVQHKQ
jgi:hypothetical protein